MDAISEYRELQSRVYALQARINELLIAKRDSAAERKPLYDEVNSALNSMVDLGWKMSEEDHEIILAGDPDEP